MKLCLIDKSPTSRLSQGKRRHTNRAESSADQDASYTHQNSNLPRSRRISQFSFAMGIYVSLCAFVCPTLVIADYIPPEQVEIKTEEYKPTLPETGNLSFSYEIAWQGLVVADALVHVEDCFSEDKKRYVKMSADARSNSFVALFYKLQHRSEGTFEVSPFRPISYTYTQKENSKSTQRAIHFLSSGTIKYESRRNQNKPTQGQFNPNNNTLDPLSAAYLARSLPMDLGKTIAVDVFNGKHRFLISFKVEALETVLIMGKQMNAYRVTPTVNRLSDSSPEKRLKQASIWISADSRRTLLKLKSEVWIGSISATLVGIEKK